MNVKQLKTHGLGAPEMESRTRANCLSEYGTFKQRVDFDCFSDSSANEVIETLENLGYETPYVAFYYHNEMIINSGTFPGSLHYWHSMFVFGWDMLRAYSDAIDNETNESAVAELQTCVDDIKEFIDLIVKYA